MKARMAHRQQRNSKMKVMMARFFNSKMKVMARMKRNPKMKVMMARMQRNSKMKVMACMHKLPCNVIQFCQTRNWIFDLDRNKWECSNCYQNGQNGFSWEIVEWEDETTNARSTKWRCCSCNQVGREYTELAASATS